MVVVAVKTPPAVVGEPCPFGDRGVPKSVDSRWAHLGETGESEQEECHSFDDTAVSDDQDVAAGMFVEHAEERSADALVESSAGSRRRRRVDSLGWTPTGTGRREGSTVRRHTRRDGAHTDHIVGSPSPAPVPTHSRLDCSPKRAGQDDVSAEPVGAREACCEQLGLLPAEIAQTGAAVRASDDRVEGSLRFGVPDQCETHRRTLERHRLTRPEPAPTTLAYRLTVATLTAPAADALLGIDSITWQVRTPLRFVAALRSALLQVARPEIAAALTSTGGFDVDPTTRIARTLGVLTTIRHGPASDAANACEQLRAVHERVSAEFDGRAVSATDPALQWWVVATIFDSVRVVDSMYLNALDRGAEAALYGEHVVLAGVLGIDPHVIPADLDAFDRWLGTEYERLDPTDDSRRLARRLLSVQALPAARLTAPAVRVLAADLLPRRLALRLDLHPTGAAQIASAACRPALRTLHRYRGRVPGRPGLRIDRFVTSRFQAVR